MISQYCYAFTRVLKKKLIQKTYKRHYNIKMKIKIKSEVIYQNERVKPVFGIECGQYGMLLCIYANVYLCFVCFCFVVFCFY